MKDHRCNDLNCPDCYPEYWQPEDDEYQAPALPYAVALLALLVALGFVVVSGAP